ncbi:predicted protein [Postia placenta Mad-698-R]|nr:predicted protein [Postia placenta Mad-698-R]
MSQNLQQPSAVQSSSDLPPPRERKRVTRSVSPPLSHVPLSRFNYIIALLAAALVAFYAWRVAQWKAEVGGWWNLALGRRPPAIQNQNHMNGANGAWAAQSDDNKRKESEPDVEQRIEELARALGVSSTDLAGAIAGVVREFVPPASLSSVAAHETGNAVKYLVDPSSVSSSAAEEAPGATASSGVGAMLHAVEAAVGMDEPPSELASNA